MHVSGASFRELDAQGRRQLARALAGQGGVLVETCSRVLLVRSQPIAVAAPLALYGEAALRHLLEVTVGLHSASPGEPAVGRQVLRAFAAAHRAGRCDATLGLLWNGLQRAVCARRRALPELDARGVQRLVALRLDAELPPERLVIVWGQGEIAAAVSAVLSQRRLHLGRGDEARLLAAAPGAGAVVVCTGAPAPYLSLPPGGGLCLDVGQPAQVLRAPGWRLVTLDALLRGGSDPLDAPRRAALAEVAARAFGAVRARFALIERPFGQPAGEAVP